MALSVIAALVLVLVVEQECVSLSDEKRLITSLLKQYANVGLYGRPVLNASAAVEVKFGIALVRIVPIKEDKDETTFAFQNWRRILWKDVLLTWSPADYGGVTNIRVPVSKIWKPDIMNFYGFPGDDIGSGEEALAVVYNTGEVLWVPPWRTQVTCPKDKDTYQCSMKFGSWAYSEKQIDLQFYEGQKTVALSDYIMSNRYDIVGSSARRNSVKYPCCTENYVSLSFNVQLKRRK